jgi:peptide/nickel transport system permease protein
MGALLQLIVRRILSAVVIIVFLTLVLFVLQHLSHESPVHSYLGAGASATAVAAETHKLGLDRPLLDQYFSYLNGLIHGNLGVSYRTRDPVTTDLKQFVPATLELAVYAMALAIVLASILGIAGAARWRGAGVFRFVMLAGSSTPPFLLALLGIVFFSGHLGWLPATGRTSLLNPPSGPTGLLTIDGLLHGEPSVTLDALRHLVLPATCIALIPAVSVGRILRSSLDETMQRDHIRSAKMKGLSEGIILLRHALRNSLGPALSMTGLQAGLMFAGVVVIEQIFAWPGIGNYVAQGIPQGDFPAIAGVTLILSIAYVAINATVDILQAIADPRIRL